MKYITLLICAVVVVSCSNAEIKPVPEITPLDPESAGEVRIYRAASKTEDYTLATVRIDSVKVAYLFQGTSISLSLNAGVYTINIFSRKQNRKTGCAIDIDLKAKEIKYIEITEIAYVITVPVPFFPNLGCNFKLNEVEAKKAEKVFTSLDAAKKVQ